MGRVGARADNAAMKSFFALLQKNDAQVRTRNASLLCGEHVRYRCELVEGLASIHRRS